MKDCKYSGDELIFISQINRDGQGVTQMKKGSQFLDKERFTLNRLSLTEGTFIASGFNSYVVKLKTTQHE